jgi:tetratricopeptide (TPR) repeat protein
MGSLAWCAGQRQIGNFQEAIAALRSKDIADPSVALELQRAYMEQGYLEKAMHCLKPLVHSSKELLSSNLNQAFNNLQLGLDDERNTSATGVATPENQLPANDSTPVARQLVMLISKYLSCSVSGDWERALDFAEIVFESYLRTWRLPLGSKESPLLLVS